MNQLTKLNNSLVKVLIVVTGFSLLAGALAAGRSAYEFETAGTDVTPEEEERMIQVLVKRDNASDSSPYVQLVAQLDEICVENPTQIIGIAATVTKKAQQDGMENYSHKEGLEELLYWVSDKGESVSCMDTYLELYAD